MTSRFASPGGTPSTTPGDGRAAERVLVGRVGAPHGLRGELAVETFSDVPGRFAAGATLLLRLPGAAARPVVIRASRPHSSRGRDGLLLRLDGVDDRTAAEGVRGALLEVEISAVPPAPADGYYHFDLVGCRCSDRRAGELGEVVEVVEGGGGDLLRVVGGGRELLLPFVDAYLAEVDVAGRRILWDLPEGLIEACGSAS